MPLDQQAKRGLISFENSLNVLVSVELVLPVMCCLIGQDSYCLTPLIFAFLVFRARYPVNVRETLRNS